MLIFDFDGVLINSLDEVTLTAYNATAGVLVTNLADLPQAVPAMFQHNRFHVQAIGDAITLMRWCVHTHRSASNRDMTPQQYRALIRREQIPLTARTQRFYDARDRFIEKDEQRWLALHTPYRPLWDALIERRLSPLVILTNKNRDATCRLCRHFGLPVREEDIYPGDHGVSKIENMAHIRIGFRLDHYDVLDDSVKNLQELDAHFNRETKILSPLFARWGYAGPEDAASAHCLGYALVEQPDVIARLND